MDTISISRSENYESVHLPIFSLDGRYQGCVFVTVLFNAVLEKRSLYRVFSVYCTLKEWEWCNWGDWGGGIKEKAFN